MSNPAQYTNWRWMAGMALDGGETGPSPDRCRVTGVLTNGQPLVRGGSRHKESPPDMNDPGTQGCVIQLVRESGAAYVSITEHEGGTALVAISDDGLNLKEYFGETLGEALAAALKALQE